MKNPPYSGPKTRLTKKNKYTIFIIVRVAYQQQQNGNAFIYFMDSSNEYLIQRHEFPAKILYWPMVSKNQFLSF